MGFLRELSPPTNMHPALGHQDEGSDASCGIVEDVRVPPQKPLAKPRLYSTFQGPGKHEEGGSVQRTP